MNQCQYQIPKPSAQRGAVLITGLILFVVLSGMVLFTFRGANTGFLISSNDVQRSSAFQAAESARMPLTDVTSKIFREYCPNREQSDDPWPLMTTVPNFLTPVDEPKLFLNDPAENPVTGQLKKDFDYELGDMKSEISVYAAEAMNAQGSNLTQYQGYHGLGKGLARGGSQQIFDIRATGRNQQGRAEVKLNGFYRFIINC
jgi:hypothetical protein